MSLQNKAVAVAACFAAAALCWQSAGAAEFTFNEKTNADLAKKLKIPVYFAVRRAPGRSSPTSRPPTSWSSSGIPTVSRRRATSDCASSSPSVGLSARLGKSGLLQTGDIMLTFRSEWGGAGAYPNIQMGISHTGFAYIDLRATCAISTTRWTANTSAPAT